MVESYAGVLTPGGCGAIAFIRMSGPGGARFLERHVRCKSGAAPPLRVGRLSHVSIIDKEELIDDAVFSCIQAVSPCFDLTVHGGIRIVERILLAAQVAGCHVLVNDQIPSVWPSSCAIDSDAWIALESTQTWRAARFVLHQRTAVVHQIESAVSLGPEELTACLQGLHLQWDRKRRLLQEATVVLIGPPNSGKSTLLNALAGRSAATVSPVAGTTRDWVEVRLDFCGVPIRLIDTAGRHESAHSEEKAAIDAGIHVAGMSDLRIYVLDATQPKSPSWDAIIRSDPAAIVAINKVDQSRIQAWVGHCGCENWRISARNGIGVDDITAFVANRLAGDEHSDEIPSAFCARQNDLIHYILDSCGSKDDDFQAKIRHDFLGTIDFGCRAGL